jgi:hypothetical protein
MMVIEDNNRANVDELWSRVSEISNGMGNPFLCKVDATCALENSATQHIASLLGLSAVFGFHFLALNRIYRVYRDAHRAAYVILAPSARRKPPRNWC